MTTDRPRFGFTGFDDPGYDKAIALSSEKLADPKPVELDYFGPDAWSLGILRGIINGAIGMTVGYGLGQLGSKSKTYEGAPNPRYRNIKAKGVAGILGFSGVMTGLYSGLKEGRQYRRQVEDLQAHVVRKRDKIGALQDELREQVKARIGMEDADPKVNRYDPEWEKKDAEAKEKEAAGKDKPAAPEDKPETRIDAAAIAAHEQRETPRSRA
jgi:hypothetical protein